MQLRIYAMYRRSKQILILMITLFLCEIAAIAFIIWQTIGPRSALQGPSNSFSQFTSRLTKAHPAITSMYSGEQFCSFSGINPDFVYIFIPFLCFESFLLYLAARVFVEDMKRNRDASDEKSFRVNSFMSVLARDSLCYFFV